MRDTHDLIHKAIGWMLREAGKRIDEKTLTNFLDQHAATMPRTALRYAVERFSPDKRLHYLSFSKRPRTVALQRRGRLKGDANRK